MSSVVDVIRHYQRSIEKCGEDEKRMLHCINKLCHLPITVQHLKETGVGRTVNSLRKYEGQVGEAAKYTVTKWKQMVADEESSEDEGDTAGTEACTDNVSEDYARAVEEEEPDDEYNNSIMRENSRHAHRESHSKSRKDDNHRSHTSKSEHKMQKEKPQRDADQSKKKHKDRHKYEDLNHTEEKQLHKRKSNSTKSHNLEEKRRKYESDNENLSDNDSESQEMQIDEQVNQGSYAVADTDEELEEEEEEEEEKEDSDANDSDNRGSVSDSSSRLMASSHTHSSKHHSSTSGSHHSGSSSVHHSKHHKESHRKHEKHKEKKSSSSDKHNRKSDSDKASERTSDSNHKDKHSKHKDNKHEHKNSKHKSSTSISSNNNSGETSKEKEHVKHKTDSEQQTAGNKKRSKEKTESAEKTSSSAKHQKPSSTKTKESKDKKRKNIVLDEDDDGITSTSGASFAEALGMFDPMIKKKTSSSGHSSSTKAPRNTNSKVSAVAEKSASKSKEMKPPKVIPAVKEEPDLLSSAVKLEPLKVDLDSTLPEISPNYRPLPHPNVDAFPQRKTKTMSDEDALAVAMSQKNQRTKVYSGFRSGKSWSSVPSLFDICVRVLQEHIEAIEFTGGVPYDLLKPVLNIATPDQLFNLEHYNPYLIEDTDELWEFHCRKSFRTKQREDMETWRDMYVRCVEEREAKLKALTSNIQQSIAKSTPVRQTKLAYVDSVVKPPRNVAKQQAKYGTATTSSANKGSPQKGPKTGISGQNAGASMSVHAAPVAMPPPRVIQSVAKVKPRMAPLMQKTMKLVKSFKR